MTRIDPKEIAIIKWGQQNNKTKDEVVEAVKRYRLTGSPALPGATPPETTVAEPVKPKGLLRRFSDFLGRKGDQIGEFGKKNIAAPIIEEGAEFIDKVGESFSRRTQKGAEFVERGAKTDDLGEMLTSGFLTGGQATGFALDVLGAGFSGILDTIGKSVPGIPDELSQEIATTVSDVGQNIADTEFVTNSLGRLMDRFVEWETKNPEKAQGLFEKGEATFNIITTGIANALTQQARAKQKLADKTRTDVTKNQGVDFQTLKKQGLVRSGNQIIDDRIISNRISDVAMKLEGGKAGAGQAFANKFGFNFNPRAGGGVTPISTGSAATQLTIDPLTSTYPQLTQAALKTASEFGMTQASAQTLLGSLRSGLSEVEKKAFAAARADVTKAVDSFAKAVGATKSTITTAIEGARGKVVSLTSPERITQWMRTETEGLLQSTRSIQNKAKVLREQRNVPLDEIIAEPHVFKGIKVKGGTIIPDEAVTHLENQIDEMLQVKQKLLPEVEKYTEAISREEIRALAYQKVSGQLSPADVKSVKAAIDKQLAAIPETVKLTELDALRAQFRASARDAKGIQKRSSEYTALENATRDLVFKTTDDLPVDTKGQFAQLNNEIKNRIATKEFIDTTLRGQKVKGGRLGGYTFKVVGAISGTTHGPFGALLGSEMGGVVQNILMNNQLGNAFKLRFLKDAGASPAALREAEIFLRQMESFTPPVLPAGARGAPTQVKSGPAIPLKEKTPSSIEADEIAKIREQRGL